MSRRLDPESPGSIHWPHTWRCMYTLGECGGLPGWQGAARRAEWFNDIEYCLDRPSTHYELKEREKEDAM